MSYTVAEVITMAQRFLLDIDDDAYNDSDQPLLDYFNEACRRFSAETFCCQKQVTASVTTNTVTYASLVSLVNASANIAQEINLIAKVTPKTGTNYTPLPRAPVSEMKALKASSVTTPTRYTEWAEAIYFDTHPDTTLNFDAIVDVCYVTNDISATDTNIYIPDQWVQAIVKYMVFCARIMDRDSGLANGAYVEFENLRNEARNYYLAQMGILPGV